MITASSYHTYINTTQKKLLKNKKAGRIVQLY